MAFSGGPDSMALLGLLRRTHGAERILALFVHHNLQLKGVTENDTLVRETCERLGTPSRVMQQSHRAPFHLVPSLPSLPLLGIPSQTLQMHWTPTELETLTKGQLQEQARLRRYRLLLEACQAAKISLMLTGHHQDDDIVTMLYRLSHGSGLEGLAGMKALSPFPIAHLWAENHFVGHPLLGVSKERLVRTCEEEGLPYNTDASNDDRDYQRNAIGSALLSMQRELARTSDDSTTSLDKTAFDLMEDLREGLELFKDIRRDIHQQVAPLFAQSFHVNRAVGDATILVGKDSQTLLANGPVLNRALGTVAQYVAARSLPVRTTRMLAVQRSLRIALTAHEEELRRRAIRGPAQEEYLRAQRPTMSQLTLGGAVVYPLSRADALRRSQLIERLTKRATTSGPAFLVQREPPGRIDNQRAAFMPEVVELLPGQAHLWDGRIYLQYADPAGASGAEVRHPPRTFVISYMTMADVRHFEVLTSRCNSLIRRPLYAYLSTTPGSHLYQVPVIRELDGEGRGGGEGEGEGEGKTSNDIMERTIYIAFPSLRVQYPLDKYQWSVRHAGNAILINKFHCLP